LNKKGFTLIELIAVLIVLSVILIIAMPNILSVKKTGMDAIKEGKINTLVSLANKKAEENIDYYQDCAGTIPSSSKCAFSISDLMEEEEELTGKLYICFNNYKLIAEAHYSESDSYNCT